MAPELKTVREYGRPVLRMVPDPTAGWRSVPLLDIIICVAVGFLIGIGVGAAFL